jgi:predicted  nucleic acid-binding Zn-ribbon protein
MNIEEALLEIIDTKQDEINKLEIENTKLKKEVENLNYEIQRLERSL